MLPPFEAPERTWSNTLSGGIRVCPYRLYLSKIGAQGGYKPNVGPKRDLFLAKKARTLPMHAGVLVHHVVRSAINWIVEGRGDRVDTEVWTARAVVRFEEDIEHSRSQKWDQPTRYLKVSDPLFIQHIHNEPLTEEDIDAAKTTISRSCSGFFSTWFQSLLPLHPEQFHLVDSLHSLDLIVPNQATGDLNAPLRLFAAPDLVIRDLNGIPWLVVDWKTSAHTDTAQLAAYAFWLVESHKDDPEPIPYDQIIGVSVPLQEPENSAQATMFDGVQKQVLDQVHADTRFMDEHTKRALGWDTFAFPPKPGKVCGSCTFNRLCPHKVNP